MQVAVEKLSPVLLELAVEVDADRVASELDKAYKDLAQSARIRGFRKGKAPRKVLSQLFGARVAQDVTQKLVEETYTQAIGEQNVQTVSQPAIEPQPLKEKASFSYKARVQIVPEVPDVKYTDFEVSRPSTTPSDEAVTAEIEQLRLANSTLEPLKEERGAQAADVLTLDLAVSVDGTEIPGAGAKDMEVELGKSQLIPELEQALAGISTGAETEVTVDFPESHPNVVLRGKRGGISVVVKDIKERVLPALDDEFAKDLGDYENLEQLRAAVIEDLGKKLSEEADNAVAERLVKALVDANPIEIPSALVQQQSRATEQQLMAQLRQGGGGGALPAEVLQGIQADSETKVRAGLLMAAIAKAEKIQIDDAAVEEGLKELSEQTGKNIAKLRAEYRAPKQREMLIGMILENKVLDVIESKSKITEEASDEKSEAE